MAKYGKAAEIAARLLANQHEVEPRSAWTRAVSQVFPDSPSSRDKGCPKDSFLALCTAGVVNGVPTGHYTRSVKNSSYMQRALAAIRLNPALLQDPARLWQLATDDAGIKANCQIEVLTTLWNAGLIRDAP